MGKKEYIRMKLNHNWRIFNGSSFEPVFSEKYFKIGSIFKKDKKMFFLSDHGLEPVPKYTANRKMLLFMLENTSAQIRINKLSKRKVQVYIKLNNNNIIETTVRYGDPFLTNIRKNNYKAKDRIEEKSLSLLDEIIKKEPRISRSGNSLIVRSINRRNYRVSITTAGVSTSTGSGICVVVPYNRSHNLNNIDLALAKALVIAYKPGGIYTLNNR